MHFLLWPKLAPAIPSLFLLLRLARCHPSPLSSRHYLSSPHRRIERELNRMTLTPTATPSKSSSQLVIVLRTPSSLAQFIIVLISLSLPLLRLTLSSAESPSEVIGAPS
ncbi:uncharacterized protein J3R85_015111 [Psidium guajava]|nr:uncharacterized protein J3R85_015111 [Psidium guajava]